MRNVELWLPCLFDFTFEGQDVDGRRIVVGSALTLPRQLVELNGVTWKAGEGEMVRWAQLAPADDARLEFKARYAFAILNELVQQAVAHRLPVKLDY